MICGPLGIARERVLPLVAKCPPLAEVVCDSRKKLCKRSSLRLPLEKIGALLVVYRRQAS